MAPAVNFPTGTPSVFDSCGNLPPKSTTDTGGKLPLLSITMAVNLPNDTGGK
jgi:hypothetical protein